MTLTTQETTGYLIVIGLCACVALAARWVWEWKKAPPPPSFQLTAEERQYHDRRPAKTRHRCTCAHTWEKIRGAPKGKDSYRCTECGGELYGQSALHGYDHGRWCTLACDPPDPYVLCQWPDCVIAPRTDEKKRADRRQRRRWDRRASVNDFITNFMTDEPGD